MLAVITSNSLATVEPSSLKRSQSPISPATVLSSPNAIAWAPDNSALYLADADGIHKFSPTGTLLETITRPDQSVSALAVKDKGNTLIYSQGREISVLETNTKKVCQTYSTHKQNIISLALSSDATLLATASPESVHIHNLSLASHSALRGLPPGAGSITTCSFHIHSRTRLIVAVGLQLAIYDTIRPSTPTKVVAIDRDKTNTGKIVAISCSPFSKTLVAVACSGGSIALVDLDKEKGLFRTLSLNTPLTSLVFSPEGASLFAGTVDGNILIVDLRALDKGPKSTSVSDSDQRVIALAIQRKLKFGDTPRKPPSTPKATKPLLPHDVNKAHHRRSSPSASQPGDKPSPSSPVTVKTKPSIASPSTRTRIVSTTPHSRNGDTPNSPHLLVKPHVRTRTISATTPASPHLKVNGAANRPATVVGRAPTNTPPARKAGPSATTKVTLPKSPLGVPATGKVISSLDVSVSEDNLLGVLKSRKENMSPKPAVATPAIRRRSSTTLSSSTPPNPRQGVRTRTTSTTSQRSTPLRTVSSSSALSTSPSIARRPTKSARPANAPTSSRPRAGSIKSNMTSPIPPPSTTLLPTLRDEEQITSIQLTESRTPSPDLPNTDVPVTPLPPTKKAKGKGREKDKGLEGINILGMGTPEVDKWIGAGDVDRLEERGGRRVGFAASETTAPSGSGTGSSFDSDSDEDGDGEGDEDTEEAKIEMTVQISPRRPIPKSTWTAVPSPLRHSNAQPHAGPSTTSSAHDLLHTLIRDALYDFRRETKAEITGLHLDLVRMGRGWKKEMRDAMDAWGTELREVREENKRLREENERLRRGY